MGEILPRIAGLSFEGWQEFLVDTNHGVAADIHLLGNEVAENENALGCEDR